MDAISRQTGYPLEAWVPETYAAAIAALCDGEADIAWLATPAYLLAHEQCLAEAVFSVRREGLASYRAQIMVQADDIRETRGLLPIRSLQDLDGKIVAFSDPMSATGYLFPRSMLTLAEVTPAEEMFVGGHAQTVLAVYRGEADGAGAFWGPLAADGSIGDARATLLSGYQDVAEVVKVLRLSAPIPYDPLVFRRGMPREARDAVVAALVELQESEEFQGILADLYGITGVALVTDADYDIVREMSRTLKLDLHQLLETSIP